MRLEKQPTDRCAACGHMRRDHGVVAASAGGILGQYCLHYRRSAKCDCEGFAESSAEWSPYPVGAA